LTIVFLVNGSSIRQIKQAESLILSPQQINTAHLQSLAWVEQLGVDG